MERKAVEIKVIGLSLILLYGTSLLTYLVAPEIDLILCFLFFMALLASTAVALLRDWGRALLVITNIFLAIYLLSPYLQHYVFSPHVSYIFMSLIVFLFFNQPRIKSRFVFGKKGKWQSILIIDDDEALIKTVRPILMSHGYSVLTANSGESGLQVVQNQKPDLVILDVILPGIKGRDVCKKIKEDKTTKHIPVVFLTAKYSEDDVKAELKAGAQAHLTKPVSAKTLITTIEQILH